jgi:hypothetical protein
MSILVYVARLSSGASHLRLSSFRSYRLNGQSKLRIGQVNSGAERFFAAKAASGDAHGKR